MQLFTRDGLLKDLSPSATDTGMHIKILKVRNTNLRENIFNAFDSDITRGPSIKGNDLNCNG